MSVFFFILHKKQRCVNFTFVEEVFFLILQSQFSLLSLILDLMNHAELIAVLFRQ